MALPRDLPIDPTQDPDRAAFLERYRHLVGFVVRRLGASVTAVFDDDDATQAGLLGLLAARDAFRDDRGASFETYAILRIRGAILDAVRALDPVGRQTRDAARRIADATANLTATLGREPSTAEVADHLGLAPERVVELRSAGAMTSISLDLATDDRSAGGSEAWADAIADPNAEDPGEAAAASDELASLVRQVALLGDRNRRVIALYYRDEMTFREIAGVLGVSESRACQIHRSALARLRERLTGVKNVARPRPTAA